MYQRFTGSAEGKKEKTPFPPITSMLFGKCINVWITLGFYLAYFHIPPLKFIPIYATSKSTSSRVLTFSVIQLVRWLQKQSSNVQWTAFTQWHFIDWKKPSSEWSIFFSETFFLEEKAGLENHNSKLKSYTTAGFSSVWVLDAAWMLFLDETFNHWMLLWLFLLCCSLSSNQICYLAHTAYNSDPEHSLQTTAIMIIHFIYWGFLGLKVTLPANDIYKSKKRNVVPNHALISDRMNKRHLKEKERTRCYKKHF